MGVYLLNGIAIRTEGGRVRASSMAGTGIADSAAEAMGIATMDMQASYPNADGWNVQIEPPVEVTEATLRTWLAAAGAPPSITLPADLLSRLRTLASERETTVEELAGRWLLAAVERAESEERVRHAIERARAGKDGG